MKKSIKKIIASMLAVIMCLGMAQTAFAAEETWYTGNNYDYDYTMENTNTTPVKTIGSSGELVVYGNFYKADSGASNIKLTVKILEYPSGRTLAEKTFENTNFPSSNNFLLACNVQRGMKIQLFFDASSINNPPGFFRKAHLHYTTYIQ